MNKTTNKSVRVKVTLPSGCDKLVKDLDQLAARHGISRGALCSAICRAAVARDFDCLRGFTNPHRTDKVNSKEKGIK